MTTSTDIEPEPMDFDDSRLTCRLCLSEDSLASVFAEKGLQKWISEFLSIVITTEDLLSQAVCAKCRIRLAHFNQYRARCQKVQSLLKAKTSEQRKGSYPAQLSVPPIQCDVCHKVFTLKRHLKDHKRNHWRKNVCKLCGKSYVERKRLEKHVKKAHENKTREDQKNSKLGKKKLVVSEVLEIKKEPLEEVEDSTTEIQEQKIEKDIDSGHIEYFASPSNEYPIKLEHDAENPSFVYDMGGNLCTMAQDEKRSALEDIFVVEEIKVEAPSELDEPLVTTEDDEYELTSQNDVHSEELVATSMENQMEFQNKIQHQRKEAQYVKCESMFSSQSLPSYHNESLHEPKKFSCLICGFRFATEIDMQLHLRSNEHLKKLAENIDSGTSYVIVEINNTANKPMEQIVSIHNDSAADTGAACNDMADNNKSPLSEELDDLKQQSKTGIDGSSSIKLSATSVNNVISYACSKCNLSFSQQCQLENHLKTHDDDVTDIDDEDSSMTEEDDADVYGKPIPKEDHKLLAPGLKIFLLRDPTEEHHPNHRMNTAEERSSVANFISIDEMSQEDSNTDGDITYSESVIAANQNPVEISEPESKDDDGRTVCTKCGKVFYDLQGFWMHHKNAHKKKYKCSLCNVVFSYKNRLEKHLLTKHKKKDGSFQPLKCEECDKVFPTTSKFTAHMALHGPRIHCCQFCPRSFSRPQHLKSHVKSHDHDDFMIPASSRPGYECRICHKVLQLKKQMQSHIRRDHGSELHKCSICSRLFKAREELEIHLESHKGTGEFSCNSGNGVQSLSEPEKFDQSQQLTLSVVSNQEASSYQRRDSIIQSSVSEQTVSLQLLQHAKRDTTQECSQKETGLEPAGPDDSLDIEAKQQSSSNYLRDQQKDELFEIEESQDINDGNTEKNPIRHNLKSLSRAIHPCSICRNQFTSKMELEQHTKTNHPEDVGIQEKYQAHKNPASSLEKSVSNEAEEVNTADATNGPVLLFEAGQFKVEPE